MYLKDSTGQEDTKLYNVAIWNGKNWTPERVTVNLNTNNIIPPFEGAVAFTSSDIWLIGSLPIHGDGQNWTIYDVRALTQSSVSLSKGWGTDSRNIYFVGRGGSAVHYDGTTWQVLASGTTLPIQDLWGAANSATGQTEILAIVSNKLGLPAGRALLNVLGNSITDAPDSGLPTSLSSLWFYPGSTYYIVGDGLFGTHQLSSASPWMSFGEGITTYYSESIRGNAPNDIVVSGDFGDLLHDNGSTWHNFREKIGQYSVLFHSVAIRTNMIVAVGERNDGIAICAVGHR